MHKTLSIKVRTGTGSTSCDSSGSLQVFDGVFGNGVTLMHMRSTCREPNSLVETVVCEHTFGDLIVRPNGERSDTALNNPRLKKDDEERERSIRSQKDCLVVGSRVREHPRGGVTVEIRGEESARAVDRNMRARRSLLTNRSRRMSKTLRRANGITHRARSALSKERPVFERPKVRTSGVIGGHSLNDASKASRTTVIVCLVDQIELV
jgi:hypothetical protein